MNVQAKSLAFAKSYHFFSQVFSKALSTGMCAELSALGLSDGTGIPAPLNDKEEAAAMHYRIFGLETLPYENVFLDDKQLPEGQRLHRLQHFFQALDFSPKCVSEEPDHLATQLAFLSHLCGLENLSHQANDTDAMYRYQKAISNFLQEHLLAWLPAYAYALREEGAEPHTQACLRFYQHITLFLLELASSQQREADNQDAALPLPTSPLQTIIERPECGLKDIATWFSTPSCSGFFIRRLDIQNIGRKLNLPTGLSHRGDMLEKLLLCAAEYGQIVSVFCELETLLRGGIDFYQSIPAAAPWLKRSKNNIRHMQHLILQANDTTSQTKPIKAQSTSQDTALPH